LAIVAAVLVVIALVRLQLSGSPGQPNAGTTEVPPQTPEVSVTAEELARDYQANEVAAQQKYGGNRLGISGEITRIRLNFRDHPTLYLKSGSLLPVQAEFDPSKSEEVAKLQVGQFITVYCGSISEVIAEPLARGCSLSGFEGAQ